jgi:hypothetical protein
MQTKVFGSRYLQGVVRLAGCRVLAAAALCVFAPVVPAQWLGYPTPGIPRAADGTPDLTAPAPRTHDGKPDFSGIWFSADTVAEACPAEGCITESRMSLLQVDLGRGVKGGLPYSNWSRQFVDVREMKDDPHAHCMPPNFPRAYTLPQYIEFVQNDRELVMLHEFNASYRQIFLDGRPLPDDPNPTWNGYSTGHWEDDTLVIDTIGIRDDMWLDLQGSPITSAAHVTERLTRPSFGTLNIELTVDDPMAYTRPWTVVFEQAIVVDTQLLEEICLDNEQDVRMFEGQ